MQAYIYEEYGSPAVLQLKEIEVPAPKNDEVLIKVAAVALNAADRHLLKGDPFLVRFDSGLTKPKNKILGADIAGRVEATGPEANRFQIGAEIFADLSSDGFGGFAEYVVVSERNLAIKPAELSFAEAAALPMAAVTALQSLTGNEPLNAGSRVLINGASGGVGTFAIQIAKTLGAEVTAVCSTKKLDLAISLGADHTIDYTRHDFTQNGQQYDLIIAANGYHPISHYNRALAPKGRYIAVGGAMTQIFQAMLLGPFHSVFSGKQMGTLLSKPNPNDLNRIKEFVEAGQVTPVVDRCFPFPELPAAFSYFVEGGAKGKIVITFDDTATK